jgi:hypothetical protein
MGRLMWVPDDGGRAAAGFTGRAGDCVIRAIAIASELPYAVLAEMLGLSDENATVMATLHVPPGHVCARRAALRGRGGVRSGRGPLVCRSVRSGGLG